LSEFVLAYRYFLDNQRQFWALVQEHLQLSLTALAIAMLLCMPLGIVAAKRRRVAQPIINGANALRVIPSLAILFLALPYFGLGFKPSLIALTVLACPPVLINTYAGFRSVDRSVIEAARGMGMAGTQVLRQIELPLALPVLLAGIRIATVEVIASASLAAFIAGGGLGVYIQRGFAVNQPSLLLVGTVPIAFLTLLADALLAGVQRAVAVPSA
jgi:osmoprotectant transport system permease protein